MFLCCKENWHTGISLGFRCLLVECGNNCYSYYGRAVLNMFKPSHLPLHAYIGLSELRIRTTAVCFFSVGGWSLRHGERNSKPFPTTKKKIQWGCMGKTKGCVCSCKSSASNVEVPVISSVECLTNILSNGGIVGQEYTQSIN